MLGGLLFGGLRAWIGGRGELTALALVIAGGLVGSALGMASVLATAYPFRKADLASLKGLMTIVLVAALLLWFVLSFLSDVLSHGLP